MAVRSAAISPLKRPRAAAAAAPVPPASLCSSTNAMSYQYDLADADSLAHKGCDVGEMKRRRRSAITKLGQIGTGLS